MTAEQDGPERRPPPACKGGRRIAAITWGITGTLGLAACVLIVIAASRGSKPLERLSRKLANVETITVAARPYTETLTLPARLEADRSAVVSSEFAGRLDRWLVEEGAEVEAGQVVALLNTLQIQAQHAQAEAARSTADKNVDVARERLEAARVAHTQAQRDAAALELDLEAARSDREFADRELERVTALAAQDIATGTDLDGARNASTQARLREEKMSDAISRARVGVESAQVAVAQARAGLGLAQAQAVEAGEAVAAVALLLEKSRLRAPCGGRLEEHLVDAGEVVAPGTPLARVYDLRHVRALVDVADRYVTFLDVSNPAVAQYMALAVPGARQQVKATVVLPGLPKLTGGAYQGLEFAATVDRIAQAADPASNTFRVALRFENPGGALKEGMIVQARIAWLHYPEAMVVPLSAVQVQDVGPRVLVVEVRDGKDVAVMRDIEPVSIQESNILVSRGVAPGDRLIVAGGKGVLDGEEVRVLVEDGVLRPEPRADVATVPGRPVATAPAASDAPGELAATPAGSAGAPAPGKGTP